MRIGVIGGMGFIGHHAVNRFIAAGHKVTVIDDFSRIGTSQNRDRNRERTSNELKIFEHDISTMSPLLVDCVKECDAILHLAGQVAVTCSVTDPRRDFESNALGTFNVLEACRLAGHFPLLIYSSTNKVYGRMDEIEVSESSRAYQYKTLTEGVPESQLLDFYSPYGCSKGAADQYVRDYSRIFGLPTVVYRQSCIYGTEQFGQEDQGWVAHISLSAIRGKPIRIFGNGKQVRDVLYIEDLLDLYDVSIKYSESVQGKIFNVGGGPKNVLSILGLVEMLSKILDIPLAPSFHTWRPGDQKVFVSDIRAIRNAVGWMPKVSPEVGVSKFIDWAQAHRAEIIQALGE